MPSQLNITISTSNGATITTSTVVVPISASLQSLDSNDSYGGGQSSQQSGYSSVDAMVANITKRGGFWNSAATTFYPIGTIQSITWQ